MEELNYDKCRMNLQLEEKYCFIYNKTKSRFFTNNQAEI